MIIIDDFLHQLQRFSLAIALPRLWIFNVILLLMMNTAPVRGALAEQPQPKAIVRDQVAIHLRLGLKDKEPTDWSGSAKVVAGRLVTIEPWRSVLMTPKNVIKGDAWQTKTICFGRLFGENPKQTQETGVILRLDQTTAETALEIATPRGDFRVSLAELAAGRPLDFLGGAVEARIIGNAQDLVVTSEKEDFPSGATAADGTVYVAYIAFTPGPDFATRPVIRKVPNDFKSYVEPTGGDRVWLLTLRGSLWSKPVAVTDGGEDLYRTATAVDAQGRVWIFFSKNVGAGADLTGGDWELFARSYQAGKLGSLIRLTHEAGPDIYPAAATDADGQVWVTWQAFRNGKAKILVARQEGDGFGQPQIVAEGPANQWCPAIAATATKPAEVTIAWDTYAKGDYDVYARTFREGIAGEPFAVAATLDFEARPAVAYDGSRRLWCAWEQSGPDWGKDYGMKASPDKRGTTLYGGDMRLMARVLDQGHWYQPPGDLDAAWPRKPQTNRDKMLLGNRVSFAHMGIDRQGRVWLSGRVWMGPSLANSWSEYVTCPGPDGWLPATLTVGRVRMLDKRPALVPDPEGGLLLIGTGTGLQRIDPTEDRKPKDDHERVVRDPDNNNLYVVPVAAPPGLGSPRLVQVATPAVATATPKSEPDDVRRVRTYRAQFDGKTLRVLRGEFHRHTELSTDGGADGSLEDMWRYALDVAAMDWLGNGDHDSGYWEYPWWLIQKTSTIFQLHDAFTAMYTYERSVNYPDGHRNAVFVQRGVRALPRLEQGLGTVMDDKPDISHPPTPDTDMFYHYLMAFDGICASHTSMSGMGTDWRDSHRLVEPIVEIYQGDRENYEAPDAPRAPRAPKAGRPVGMNWHPLGFVNRALLKGIHLGFECSSDHHSTHISYCNVYVEIPGRQEILKAMKARHVYGSTDNIVADVRWTAGGEEHFMGDEFTANKAPAVHIHLEGTAPFAKVSIIKDNEYVYSSSPKQAVVDFNWSDREPKAGTSYYYVRGEQVDGELVWVSPVWINYAGSP